MAIIAIHPGEHLAEELKELKMSAAELARKLEVPTNRVTGILKRPARYHGRYSPAPRAFLWNQPGVLAEFAKPLRTASRSKESW